jgi:hypothetical protein
MIGTPWMSFDGSRGAIWKTACNGGCEASYSDRTRRSSSSAQLTTIVTGWASTGSSRTPVGTDRGEPH